MTISYPVSREQIKAARVADLYSFLQLYYEDRFKRVGRCLCMRDRPSLYINSLVPGYHDFANNDHGNSIDFLIRHLHYSFVGAVQALAPEGSSAVRLILPPVHPDCPKVIILPEKADPPFSRVYAYLSNRGLPGDFISELFEAGILYQDIPYGNAVFITPEKDYYEARGTLSNTEKPFRQCRKKKPNCFWYYTDNTLPKVAYICESAIDALSLFLLYKESDVSVPAVFVSIGGVANQQAISRIKSRMPAVLAVDNDDAGYACRKRNLDIPAVVPLLKDWNDDLRNGKTVKLVHPFPYQMCLC